jgi:cholesterol oxidase
MQHKGRLTGPSSELGQRARTNSEQLLAVTRTHGQWTDDPEKIHITPGSVAITSGVWPDAVTSVEPTIWGVGSDLFAFLVTQHQHGEQKHATASWLKELIARPAQVLSFDDARHWSERTVIMLCMQTTDTSIELYWHDGLLRSRQGSTAPPVHIPVIEDFVDRVARKMDSSEGRCCSRPSTATPRPTSSAGSRSATAARPAPSTPTCACSASPACTSWTAASCRPTPA